MNKRDKILEYFSILKKRGLVGSSYLFIGEEFSLVDDIVKLINCPQASGFCGSCWDCRMLEQASHPDLFVIEPENLTTRIEAVREGAKALSLKSFSLKAKPLIIKDAQSLSPAAANSFLKTLEEPPKNSFIALCATKLEGVLPTIISRCRKVFLPSGGQQPEKFAAQDISGILKAKTAVFKDRKEFRSFIWAFIELLHAELLTRAGCGATRACPGHHILRPWGGILSDGERLEGVEPEPKGQNNRLPYKGECEIILKPFDIEKICIILKDILRIYEVSGSVNMNLALNLIKTRINADFEERG